MSDRRCPFQRGVFFFLVFFLGGVCPFTPGDLGAQSLEQASSSPTAADRCLLVEAEGTVEVTLDNNAPWKTVGSGQTLYFGSTVRTGEFSRAALQLPGGSVLRLNELSTIKLAPQPNRNSEKPKINLRQGALYFFSRTRPEEVEISTPGANGAIRGTEITIRADPDGHSAIDVLDGAVEWSAMGVCLSLHSGQSAIARPGEAPRLSPAVDLRRNIQWTLYYPAVLEPSDLALSADDIQRLGEYWRHYLAGRLGQARPPMSAMDDWPTPSAGVRIFRAATALASGQVETAERDLAALPPQGPGVGALRELIAVIRGDHAVPSTHPQTASDWLARSYTEQARGHFEAASAAVRQATTLPSAGGLGWARQAEMDFSAGNLTAAQTALDRALAMAPGHAYAHAVHGFILAGTQRYEEAMEAFERALANDRALSLAWLGRGLCRWRMGDPAAGGRDLQIAAALDPNRSLLRSYLAKAWAARGARELAFRELDRAESIDPDDPTPLLYRALLLQDTNSPNAARRAMEKSLVLNDNRALFRSRLLLDEDRAVRRANLARIFADNGLAARARSEAGLALADDYANSAAHRFLAHVFADKLDPAQIDTRYQTPWFSEWFLANLLAPPGGAELSATISNSEYSSLLTEAGHRWAGWSRWESRGRLFAEAGWSTVADQTEFSADGTLTHFDSEYGNDDLRRVGFSASGKFRSGPRDSLTVWLHGEETRHGDVYPYADPQTRDPDYRTEERQEPLAVAGWHRRWASGQHTLAMAGFLRLREEVDNPAAKAVSHQANNGILLARGRIAGDWLWRQRQTGGTAEIQHVVTHGDGQWLLGGQWQTAHFSVEDSFATDRAGHSLFEQQRLSGQMQRLSGSVIWRQRWLDWFETMAGGGYAWLRFPRGLDTTPALSGSEDKAVWTPRLGWVARPAGWLVITGAAGQNMGGYGIEAPMRLEPAHLYGHLLQYRSLAPEAVIGSLSAEKVRSVHSSIEASLTENWRTGFGGYAAQGSAGRTQGSIYYPTLGSPLAPPAPEQLAWREEFEYEEAQFQGHLSWLGGGEWNVSLFGEFTASVLERQSFVPLANPRPMASQYPTAWERSRLWRSGISAAWRTPSGWFVKGLVAGWFQENDAARNSLPNDEYWQSEITIGHAWTGGRGRISLTAVNLLDRNHRLSPLNPFREPARDLGWILEARFTF